MKLRCRHCDKLIDVSEFDYAMWCKGKLIYCEKCQEEFDKNINKARVEKKRY